MTKDQSAGPADDARQALADIKWDVHNCDWNCEVCGARQGMEDTDIASTIRRFEEAHGSLPVPYSSNATPTKPKGKRGGRRNGTPCR